MKTRFTVLSSPFCARGAPESARGFSLFELVVFIICVAIIYAFAANRFAAFPAQAERANFVAITTQLQSSLNLEVMTVMASGRGGLVEMFDGVNPMDLLLRTPSNYIGAYSGIDSRTLDRRTWFFDQNKRELVYLVNDIGGVFYSINSTLVPTDEIRFKVQVGRTEIDSRTGFAAALSSSGGGVPAEYTQSRASGVVLEPVIPFVWGTDVDDQAVIDASIAISQG